MKKVVIITGAASGLGLELAKILHMNDYFVCVVDKDEKGLNKLAKILTNNFQSYVGNVADEKFALKTIKEIARNFCIFALINCAGSPSFKLPTNYTEKDVDLCF